MPIMPQATTDDNLKSSLPRELLPTPNFLLWKHYRDPDTGKLRKAPYYVNGLMRRGGLDSEKDLKNLVGFDIAYQVFKRDRDSKGYAGIGYALTGNGIAAFDLDHCLLPSGAVDPSHPGFWLVKAAEKEGCYIEVSPSGQGLRILGPCDMSTPYSKGGVEFWGAKRFVTLTGRVFANPAGWKSLNNLRGALDPVPDYRYEDAPTWNDPDDVIVTPRLIHDLESALRAIDADEREVWVRMGMALKGLGVNGYDLWLEWSKKSKKFNQEDADRVWESFQPNKISYRSVFTEARDEWGWVNPKSSTRHKGADEYDPEFPPRMAEIGEPRDATEGEGTLPTPDRLRVPLGALELLPTEFVLDNFLPTGVSVIAGAWGAGKSTNLIPVFAAVAHLAPEDWGLTPQLRRKVIWMTEAPSQARDTLYSMAKAGGCASWEEIGEWFLLFQARRVKPKRMASILKALVEAHSYDLPNGFRVYPVVVLDTVSANLDLENESDNSEVAAAVNTLKQDLTSAPIVLIGHTTKALSRADVEDITFRGAGAWEADAVATYFLVHDTDIDMRFIALRKSRFTPGFTELSFGTQGGSEVIPTPWGEPQTKGYVHGIPQLSSREARKAAKAEVLESKREEAKERRMSDRQSKILAVLSEAAAEGRPLTKMESWGLVGGSKDLHFEAMARLLEAGLTFDVEEPEEWKKARKGRGGKVFTFPHGVDPEVYFTTHLPPVEEVDSEG